MNADGSEHHRLTQSRMTIHTLDLVVNRSFPIEAQKMDIKQTQRGFAIGKFTDRYSVPCSIQKSSIADEHCIWFGADEIGLKRFEPGGGWSDIELESTPFGVTYQANTRMHLTQKMVQKLLPTLQHFAETGELPQ